MASKIPNKINITNTGIRILGKPIEEKSITREDTGIVGKPIEEKSITREDTRFIGPPIKEIGITREDTKILGKPVSISILPPPTGKLKDYAVYYNDTEENSKFFQISKFPESLASGKNSFLITGTDLLLPTTPVMVEVLNVKGEELSITIPNLLLNGTDRIIVIEVPTTEYYGKGLVTILGQAIDVPKEWRGAYNVKWQREVLINPSLDNSSDTYFINDPILSITEIYDTSNTISGVNFVNNLYNQGLVYSKIGKSFLRPSQYSYYLHLKDGPPATTNALFDGLAGWDTSSTYISAVTSSDSKLYFSQSYGLFGVTDGVKQNFSMSANVVYTLNAEFKGTESELGSSVASVSVYSGSNLIYYGQTSEVTDVTLATQFSSSVDKIATLELSGQAFAIKTVWSNVYVANLISGSAGNNGFNIQMEGAKLVISASNMTVVPNTELYQVSGAYETTIYKVLNPQTAILANSYEAFNTTTKNKQRVEFISASYNIFWDKEVSVINTNFQNSYLELFYKNLQTHSGYLKYIELYKNPGNKSVGRYPAESLNILTTGYDFTEIQDFTDNWTDEGTGSYSSIHGGGGGII